MDPPKLNICKQRITQLKGNSAAARKSFIISFLLEADVQKDKFMEDKFISNYKPWYLGKKSNSEALILSIPDPRGNIRDSLDLYVLLLVIQKNCCSMYETGCCTRWTLGLTEGSAFDLMTTFATRYTTKLWILSIHTTLISVECTFGYLDPSKPQFLLAKFNYMIWVKVIII